MYDEGEVEISTLIGGYFSITEQEAFQQRLLDYLSGETKPLHPINSSSKSRIAGCSVYSSIQSISAQLKGTEPRLFVH